ncbi:MAG: type II toxin-antitoxin system HipA family toxin [Ruminococcus sp.]|jgi:serine/threonine-protein kinase HipA|nr:type II toxin-antitoxin system HipA family toxin [Ruminococcus sp.]
MRENSRKIYVYENWSRDIPVKMGTLYADGNRGKEVYSFEYDNEWLKNRDAIITFDPDLGLYNGRQYVPMDKQIFGIFADSCPDRWGRLLMKRREAIIARKEERRPKALNELDFLLGVYDEARMGAIRFKNSEDGEFLSCDKELATPPWTTLRTLESASIEFEKDESGINEKWLKQLLAPGSSLGGARPKATVQAPDSSLWIAKFPSKHDDVDSGAWEMTVHDLAELYGLNVPLAKAEQFSRNGTTFLVKRFDRNGKKRLHFSSSMTLLGQTDGASATNGISYLDIASFIRANGSQPQADLIELWKRIVFNIAVANTDDHLRNHGFILDDYGWRLSPLYDVNPNIYGDCLSLNITDEDASLNFNLALETAEFYGISEKKAIEEIDKVKKIVVNNWERLASKYQLSRSAIEYMRPAFDMKFKEC